MFLDHNAGKNVAKIAFLLSCFINGIDLLPITVLILSTSNQILNTIYGKMYAHIYDESTAF